MNSDILTEIFEYTEKRVELRFVCKEWSQLIIPLVWINERSNIDKPLIRKLKITNQMIQDDEFKQLIKQCPNIESLDCSDCKNLTQEGISELGHVKEFICCFCNFTSLNHLKSAKNIDCSGCENLTWEGILKPDLVN